MWNSNSVTSWLLAGAGVEVGSIRPPAGGAGWEAGLVVARRHAGQVRPVSSEPLVRGPRVAHEYVQPGS
jgi:hypothetical protein